MDVINNRIAHVTWVIASNTMNVIWAKAIKEAKAATGNRGAKAAKGNRGAKAATGNRGNRGAKATEGAKATKIL